MHQEFLVRIEIRLPEAMSADQREHLRREESERGTELRATGHIVRIWRVPGQTANLGIWAADSTTELHNLIASLPLFPWIHVQVEALATHPLESEEQ